MRPLRTLWLKNQEDLTAENAEFAKTDFVVGHLRRFNRRERIERKKAFLCDLCVLCGCGQPSVTRRYLQWASFYWSFGLS